MPTLSKAQKKELFEVLTPEDRHSLAELAGQKVAMGRSRGGLTSKIHAVVDANRLPVRLGLTTGEAHDNRLAGLDLPVFFAS